MNQMDARNVAYIDMGEGITGKHDRPSLIIECPQGPPNSKKKTPSAGRQRSFSNADSSVVGVATASIFHLKAGFLENGLITFFILWHGASSGRYIGIIWNWLNRPKM